MSELIDRKRFSADMRDFQNRVGIWRDEAEDTETRTRADAALATIIETKLILDKQPTVAAASPWHRVEEPPKEEHRTYLVYTNTGYMCSCRWTNNVYGLGESDRWGWCLVDIPQFQKVVYWMPVEPPKEVQDADT